MISKKVLALAGIAILAAAQSTWAANPPRPTNGPGLNARPTAQPASPPAGSPTIYYSNQPYVQPSIVPPSMNLLPSFGYSTGFAVTGMGNMNLGYSTGFGSTRTSGVTPMNNMNLGYSTGFTVTGLNLPVTTPGLATLGNRTYSPPSYTYVGPAYNYVPPLIIVNQTNYYQAPVLYNYTTNIAPQPRLTFGVLNN